MVKQNSQEGKEPKRVELGAVKAQCPSRLGDSGLDGDRNPISGIHYNCFLGAHGYNYDPTRLSLALTVMSVDVRGTTRYSLARALLVRPSAGAKS